MLEVVRLSDCPVSKPVGRVDCKIGTLSKLNLIKKIVKETDEFCLAHQQLALASGFLVITVKRPKIKKPNVQKANFRQT